MKQNSVFKKNTFNISPEIQQMALENELGELYRVYTIPIQNTTPFGIGGLCICFSFCIIPFVLFLDSPPPAITISGLVLLLVGCFMIFLSRMYPGKHIYLWQYGFLYEKGQVRQVFQWDLIENIQSHSNAQQFIRYNIRHQDGYTVTVSSAFSDINEFMSYVFEAFARQVSSQDLIIAPPRTIRTFIDIKLDRQGIGNAQETLPWHEIQEFLIEDGKIILRKRKE